jgi:hypothetical protein
MYSFIPAIRHGVNEQKALKRLHQHLNQGPGNPQQQPNRVKPLVEIIEDDDLNNLAHYTNRYDEVLVDFPRYLVDRENMHSDDVGDLINEYSNDPVTFHSRNSSKDCTPVISGSLDPINHANFKQYIQDLSTDFSRLCIRLFVPIRKYNQVERGELKDIISETRDDDAILADVPDVADLSDGVRPNIEFIKDQLDHQDFYVFDLFEPRGEVNYNYGLVMGKYADVDGVGDFAIEPRFQQDIPDAAFQHIPKRVRQYESPNHSVSTTEDSDNYVNAVETMIQNGDLDPNHCPACRELHDEYQNVQADPNRKDLDAGFVKQKRMNHYTYSVLNEEFPDMTAATDAKDFDQEGYDDIT